MKESVIHMWDVHEITLHSVNTYNNPYTDVTVWADLKGPGFDKRVYGFWDGDNIWKIRMTATAPGAWTYTTGSSVPDVGLAGISGGYFALEWTEEEKEENPCRRGIIRATENGHAMEYADGTPYVMVGDTWWPLATYRFPWTEDDVHHEPGPDMTLKDMIRIRKSQGYNCIGTIVAYPTWAKDGKPYTITIPDEHDTCVRNAWAVCGVEDWFKKDPGRVITARDMHNEGGRPFFFPGKIKVYEDLVPDYDRINPAYFQAFDKKVNYLNANGFTVFMEALRRDSSKTWKYYYDWPMVYTRYIQYLSARYQANNTIFSPIHFDVKSYTIDAREFNEPIDLMIDLYGAPPFGTLLGTNAPGSTKTAFGSLGEQKWKTMDQTGNFRDHEHYWLMEDIFEDEHPVPAINGEPYYSGHVAIMTNNKGELVENIFGNVDSPEDHMNFRSSLYGSLLSGGFGGNLAGFEAGWSANVEPEENPWKIWDVMTFPASYQTRYYRDFILSEGKRYQDLIPEPDLLFPCKAGAPTGWRGWAYAAATKERDLIFGYLEKDCPQPRLRGLRPYDIYEITFFDPRTGKWMENSFRLEANHFGSLLLPETPDEFDWAFKAKKVNQEQRVDTQGPGLVRGSDVTFTFIQTDSTK